MFPITQTRNNKLTHQQALTLNSEYSKMMGITSSNGFLLEFKRDW